MSSSATRRSFAAPWALCAALALGGCFAGAPVELYECSDMHDMPCPGGQICITFKCYTLCNADEQCPAGASCQDSVCLPANCTQTSQCGASYFCDAGTCNKRLVQGKPCPSRDDACLSGSCEDGVCCESACEGTCRACASGLTGVADGICSFIPLGQDPADECPGEAACNGMGVCPTRAWGEECASDIECATSRCVDGVCCESACEGECFSCRGAETGSVDGACKPILARTDPADECEDQLVCTGTEDGCYGRALGEQCSEAHECKSGFCADGVCCNSACEGTCQACDGVDHESPGECLPVRNTVDPGTCSAGELTGHCVVPEICATTPNHPSCKDFSCVCDEGGECRRSPASTCYADEDCTSRECVDSVCCIDSHCEGGCKSCNADYTGAAPGECANITVDQDPRNACPGGASCNGNGGCFSSMPGETCSKSYECTTGLCSRDEGVCCDQNCDGGCQKCTGPDRVNTAPGVCSNIVAGKDPDNACPTAAACNGQNACYSTPVGGYCAHDYECEMGNCNESTHQCERPWLPPPTLPGR